MHALIIEDEPSIALPIEDHLRAIGYRSVDFAVTEADAVAPARRRCPDLITSDVRLAAGCGIAAVEAIRSACRQRAGCAPPGGKRGGGRQPFLAADLGRAPHAARLA